MFTRASSSSVRLAASSLLMFMRFTSDSANCEPTLRTGLSAVIGSWKIIAMRRPQKFLICSLDSVSSSSPSIFTLPERCTFLPRSKPIAARDITVFPEPDSPTMPTLSPLRIESETPRTACKGPRLVSNVICRLSTSKSSLIFATLFRQSWSGSSRRNSSGP